MKKQGLLDPADAIIEPLFIKQILEYLNPRKLKPLAIDIYIYDETKDSIDDV